MKGRLVVWLLSFSPAMAGLASYGINLLAAISLNSVVDYSLYLSLQSWAVYFGAVSALGLVDMKLSPNGRCYSAFQLFGLSIITSLLGAICLALVSAVTGSITSLVVGITGFIYAAYQSLMMASLMVKISTVPVILRFARAVLLLVLGGALMTGVTGQSSPLYFMGAQALAAAIAISSFSMKLPAVPFSLISATMRKIWMLDRGRWVKRNLSYIIDMAHYPLFYTAFGMIAEISEPEHRKTIYIAGLLVPVAAILNQMISERLRLNFGLTGLSGLRSRFATYSRIGHTLLIVYLIIYVSTLFLCGASLMAIISHQLVLAILLFVHALFILHSSTCGVIMSHAGLERLDLTINSFVLFMLVVFIYGLEFGATSLQFVVMLISSKYMAQLLIAYSTIFVKSKEK